MKDEPLVSIALCTYNGSKFLPQQLDSILAQTYRNLEIVIVDDCSTDNTFAIISNYAQKNSRIRAFKNEVNLGYNRNFEYAIKLTTGEYIAISDQDDIWLPQKIQVLMCSIGDNWLICSNSTFINESGEVLDGRMLRDFDFDTGNYKGMLLANFVTGHTTLFKRAFIDHFLPFPEKGFYDCWMGFVAFYHQKIVFINDILTQYRIHGESVMQNLVVTGREQREEVMAIDDMLSAFASYKHLKEADAVFIKQLKEAYQLAVSAKNIIPLIKIIFDNYTIFFVNHKPRKGLSRLNFAIKYARKAAKYARG